MTNEERDIITQFIERLSGHAPAAASGSVPSAAPALPPVDPEADSLIGDMFNRFPEARYRLTQTAFVQEHALIEAQGRMQRMQAELDQAHQAQAGGAPGSAAPARSGGFFSGLFGGSVAQAGPPVQPSQFQGQSQGQPQPSPVWNRGQAAQPGYGQQYAPPPPQFAPQAMQQGGTGFLGSALRTAAGVAGGVVAGNLLMDAFSGHGGGMFGGGGMMPGIGGNFGGGMGGGESPWAAPGPDPAVDQGSWTTDAPADQGGTSDAGNDPGWSDQQASTDGGSWSDNSGGGDTGGGDFGGGDGGGGDGGGGDWS